MTAEEKLAKIASIYETKTERGYESTHLRHNLLGAIFDLKRMNKPDKVIFDTLDRVHKQLAEIEQFLDLK